MDVKDLIEDYEDNVGEELKDRLGNEHEFMDVEIIYYARAMEYLTEYDTSLTYSLELANDMGYDCANLNSEILASILASENNRDDFYDTFPVDEINDFVSDMLEYLEEEEE